MPYRYFERIGPMTPLKLWGDPENRKTRLEVSDQKKLNRAIRSVLGVFVDGEFLTPMSPAYGKLDLILFEHFADCS